MEKLRKEYLHLHYFKKRFQNTGKFDFDLYILNQHLKYENKI